MTEDISLISILGLLLVFFSSTGAVTLSGSSEYAVVGSPFTLTCDVPDGANNVTFYRTLPLMISSIRVVNSNCVLYNQSLTLPCEDTLCACEPSAADQGRSFNLTITPTTQDHSSIWFCVGYTSGSSNNTAYSPSYILQEAKGPGADLSISPSSTRYTRDEGDILPDITCTADCRPRCSYVWTKPDNTDITSSVLALRGLSRAEDGTYRCTARNEYGTNSITVTVVVNYGPGASVALSPSTNLYIRNEGDILPDITCTADCRPSCLFVWTKPNNSNFTTSPLLSLGQLSRTEHGHYICNAWNGVGSATREINVTVQYGPALSVALSPPDFLYIRNEGATLPAITCAADCRPSCSLVWTKPDNTNFTISAVLSLGQLDRSEHGRYVCHAWNGVSSATQELSVTVQYGPGASVALSPPSNLYIRNEGDILPDITCTADCRPSCLFVWTKPNNSNFTTSPLLSLGQLSRTEHGHYICNAWNGVGSATREINVTVQYGPALSVALSPPDFLYIRNEGATLPAITCAADCRPSCSLVWTKPDNTNFTISAVLSLGQLDRSEHGRYVCHAWNGVSSATQELSVTVQYGPGNSITYQTAATVDRLENQSVPDITCDADCRPPCSYSWSKDNSQYSNPLSLSLASRNNAGIYRCRASNAVSVSVKDWTLVVRYPPKILSLGYTQGNADVKENETKSLSCKVESYPPSNITWYYKANNTVLLIAPGATDSTFTLTKAGCLDTGFYTCSAKNSVSSSPSTSDIHVNVLCKPRIDTRLNTIVKVGIGLSRDLLLTASYLSNPEPKFTWQFHMEGITENLVHGKERVSIRSTYSNSTVSAVSTITRTRMEERWLGIYIVTVANDQGSDTLVYTVTAADKPNSPYEGKVDCPFTDRAVLSWTSDFNGGSEQKFIVGMKGDQEGFYVINTNTKYDDPGRGRAVEAELSDLSPDTLYFFTVIAINEYGNASLVDEVNCTTTAIPPVEDSNTAGIVAGVVVSVLIIAIIVVAVFIFRRKIFQFFKKDDETEMSSSGKRTNDTYDSLDPEQVAAPNIYDQMHPNVTANQDNEGNINSTYDAFRTNEDPAAVYEDPHHSPGKEPESTIPKADPKGLQKPSNESHRYMNVIFKGHDPIYENTTANAAKPAAKKRKRNKKRKNET